MQLVQLFTQYFTKVKEKYIRENFVLIYELLDEVCDNGVPQITEPSVLKEYIFQKGTFLREKKESASDVTLQVCASARQRACVARADLSRSHWHCLPPGASEVPRPPPL